MSHKDDQALVKEYLQLRDEQSFRELYRRHTPAFYALALRLCRSEANAQDVIQEVWIRACRTLSRFMWKSSLRTWLGGVLINCAREQSRQQNNRREEELTDDFPATINQRLGDRITLEEAILRLPDGYRHVLTLHDVEGYTHEEISGLLDISAGTSKSQLFKAKEQLRHLLQKYFYVTHNNKKGTE